jgi:hypothetical protein
MINWKRFGRKRSWPNLRNYPSISLERLRKTTKTPSQDSRCPGRNFNLGPPEYEATRPQSVLIHKVAAVSKNDAVKTHRWCVRKTPHRP